LVHAVLFDLDNTLYPEAEFVRSGFTAVANFLHDRFDVDAATATAQMEARLDDRGREEVFDWLVDQLDWRSTLGALVHVYRIHGSRLAPFPDATEGLTELRRRGILSDLVSEVTSGVQRGKVAGLGLYDFMATVVVTDELGPDAS
jgi:putative hydrolase of the HAD superfamily